MFWEVPHQQREERLWQAVILIHVRDALNPVSHLNPPHQKSAADKWLRRKGKGFREVCAMAGMDPDFLSEAYASGRIDGSALKHVLAA